MAKAGSLLPSCDASTPKVLSFLNESEDKSADYSDDLSSTPTDDIADSLSTSELRDHVAKAGSLLLSCDASALEVFLSEASSTTALASFCKSEDSSLILQLSSSKADENNSASNDESSFDLFSEITASMFDSPSSDTISSKTLIFFMKINNAPLAPDTNVSSQLWISSFDTSKPMIDYLRNFNIFVHVATLHAQQEKAQGAIEMIREMRQRKKYKKMKKKLKKKLKKARTEKRKRKSSDIILANIPKPQVKRQRLHVRDPTRTYRSATECSKAKSIAKKNKAEVDGKKKGRKQ